MLTVLMIFCATGAVFLIGLGAYAEYRELRESGKHGAHGHPAMRPHR